MIDWIKTVWGRRPGGLLKKKALLVMDAFRGHLHKSVREQLKTMKTDVAIIPGGMTGILQPLDVGVNKPFKDRIRQKWVDWLQRDDHAFTPRGNLKRPALATVCGWVKDSWEDIPSELITRAFLKCSISNRLDGTEDDALFDSGTETNAESEDSDVNLLAERYDDLVTMFGHSDDSEEEFLGF